VTCMQGQRLTAGTRTDPCGRDHTKSGYRATTHSVQQLPIVRSSREHAGAATPPRASHNCTYGKGQSDYRYLLIEVEAERMPGRVEEYPHVLLGLILSDARA
jgi:hypothetical protein